MITGSSCGNRLGPKRRANCLIGPSKPFLKPLAPSGCAPEIRITRSSALDAGSPLTRFPSAKLRLAWPGSKGPAPGEASHPSTSEKGAPRHRRRYNLLLGREGNPGFGDEPETPRI